MRKLSSTFVTTLAGIAALLAGACSSSKGPSGSTGSAGADGGSGFVGVALIPSTTGFVDDTGSGVIGAWYSYGDSAGPAASVTSTDAADSACIGKGHFTADQCSQIASPIPGQPFPPDTTMPGTGAMCTHGTAAQVQMNAAGTADYSDLFGAGIGLDFNNPGGEGGAPKGYFDMSPYTGIGFDFTGTVIPTGKMRVNFPFNGENGGTDSPYWDGATMDSSPLTNGGHISIKWGDVGGPKYLLSQTPSITPPAFDKTKVASIQFQVFTNLTASVPYSFCVNNLTLLTN
jgi:hypothetical protein